MTSTKISEMTLKQISAFALDQITKQGLSFILICMLAWISFDRMERMENSREKDRKEHSAELSRIYSDLFTKQVEAITASTKALEQNTDVMEEVKDILAERGK